MDAEGSDAKFLAFCKAIFVSSCPDFLPTLPHLPPTAQQPAMAIKCVQNNLIHMNELLIDRSYLILLSRQGKVVCGRLPLFHCVRY